MTGDRAAASVASVPTVALLDAIASRSPTPGAGPAAAWTCAIAAALVQMTYAVMAAKSEDTNADSERRGRRAHELRDLAVELADADATAYGRVLAVLRRREEPGHAKRLREALSLAADPPLTIAEVAAEVTRLAADAAEQASGGVRGEARTAAVLGEAVVRAAEVMVIMNLGGRTDDPRRAEIATLAELASRDLERASRSMP